MTASTLQRLRAAITDPGRLAPVSRWAGLALDEVEPGRVRARLPSSTILPGPGAALLLADFVLGAAIGTHLPAGRRVGTLTLHASLLADPSGGLVAAGTLTQLAGDSGVSHAEVHDEHGLLVAALSCRCAVLDSTGSGAPGTPAGKVVDPLVADPALANLGGGVQGGVLAAALARVLEVERGELDVTFLRPVPADGAAFAVRAESVHGGSRFTVGRAELRCARGRPAVVATGSRWAVR